MELGPGAVSTADPAKDGPWQQQSSRGHLLDWAEGAGGQEAGGLWPCLGGAVGRCAALRGQSLERWRDAALDARRLAAASAGIGGVPAAAGVGTLEPRGDLAKIGAGQQGLQPVEFHEWTRSMQSAAGVTLRWPQPGADGQGAADGGTGAAAAAVAEEAAATAEETMTPDTYKRQRQRQI